MASIFTLERRSSDSEAEHIEEPTLPKTHKQFAVDAPAVKIFFVVGVHGAVLGSLTK